MRLSELMSAMSPTRFTEIALLLFLAVFAAVAVRAFGRGARQRSAEAAALPLYDDDGAPAARRGGAGSAP